MHFGQFFPRYTRPIIVGERDQRSMLVTDTEYVALHQLFPERLIAANTLPLIPQPVERFLARWMRVYKKQTIPIAYNLRMQGGDDGLRNGDIILGITPDIEDLFVQDMHLLITMNIAAHGQRRHADFRPGGKRSSGSGHNGRYIDR